MITIDFIDRSYAKKLAAGFKVIRENDTHDGIYYETTTGAKFDVKLPNFHSHINLAILEKFSYDSTNNQLLYDGQPIASGGAGTTNYVDLTNKPSINGITLEGNKTLEELGIQAIEKNTLDKTIVCVIDDDGTTRTNDSYTGMTTWLNNQGIPLGFAICYDTIGTSGKYTVAQLQELQAKGNDILIHGNTRLQDFTTVDEVREELEKAKQFNIDNSLFPQNIYVYPEGLNGDYTLTADEVKTTVGEYFDYALNVNIASMSSTDTKGLWNKVPLEDELNLSRMEIKDTKGLSQYQNNIDSCVANKGLLILFTHSFRSTFATTGYDNFKEVISYLLTQDVEFMNVSDALEKIEKLSKSYNDLTNKPRINGIKLEGNKSLSDIGIEALTEQEVKDIWDEILNNV